MTYVGGAEIRDPEEFERSVVERRSKRMAAIDALAPELRELVHEYGYTVVRAFLDHHVTKPNAIRHLVENVLNEFSPTRGSFAAQGVRTMHEVADPTRHPIQEP